jgi:hypothetical protein
MVQMWKLSLVAEAVESDRYTEVHMSLNVGMISTIPQHTGFMGKAPRTLSWGGSSRPPPYGNRAAPRTIATCISRETSTTSQSSPAMQTGPRPSRGATSRGRGSMEGTHFRGLHRPSQGSA